MIKYLLYLLASTTLFIISTIAQAQTYTPSDRIPIADNSQIGTQVSGINNQFKIDGGLQRGQNLFHSFTDFSVPTGGSANFTNPTGNQSIITRVTGNLYSDLNGLIQTNGANFLLINPNGVVFGEGVSLDVGKAFVTSTASGVDFVDAQGKSYNFGVNQAGDVPLINIDSTVAFNPAKLLMNASIPGSKGIENYGTIQTKNDSQYIGLIGGDIKLNGGKIIAPGGRIDLGGLNTAGTISTDDRGLVFGGNSLIRSDLSLSNNAQVIVRVNQVLAKVTPFFSNAVSPGSSININSKDLIITNDPSQVITGSIDAGLAEKSGVKTLKAGSINIDSTGKISLTNAQIKNTIRAKSDGKIGDVNIKAQGNIEILNNSIISSVTSGIGDSGNIELNTKGNLTIVGTNNPLLLTGEKAERSPLSNIISGSSGQGDSGKITLNIGGKLSISNRGGITGTVTPLGIGNGQKIKIDAGELELTNRSTIANGTFQSQAANGKGNAGDIEITTRGDIKLSGYNPQLTKPTDRDSATITNSTARVGDTGKITIKTNGKLSIENKGAIVSSISPIAVGNSKGIEIDVGELVLINDASILTNTLQSQAVPGQGNGGNIKITTAGNITMIGNPDNDLSATISSATYGKGDAGKIEIDTKGKLSMTDESAIYSTVSAGANGNSKGIKISAGELILSNKSQIETTSFQNLKVNNQGNAGDIEIINKGDLNLLTGAKISSNSINQGSAGNILINSDRLLLNDAGILSAAKSVSGGNIQLNILDRLLLRNDSLIATDSNSTGKNGNGGNISIDSPLIVALPAGNFGGNDITANAYNGTGGKVKISTQGLFGIQYRLKGSDLTNDITVSSSFGQNGNVQIKTPGIDPGKDKGELPVAPNDASKQIAQTCGANQRDNKFYLTGRGGLPPTAREPQESDAPWIDARATKTLTPTAQQPPQLPLPAIGWVFGKDGKVRLIAAHTAVSTTGNPVRCPTN